MNSTNVELLTKGHLFFNSIELTTAVCFIFPITAASIGTVQTYKNVISGVEGTSPWYVIGSLYTSAFNFYYYLLSFLRAAYLTKASNITSKFFFVRPFFYILSTTTFTSSLEFLSFWYTYKSITKDSALIKNTKHVKYYRKVTNFFFMFSIPILILSTVLTFVVFWINNQNLFDVTFNFFSIISTVFSIVQFSSEVYEIFAKRGRTTLNFPSLVLPLGSNIFLLKGILDDFFITFKFTTKIWMEGLPYFATIILQVLIIMRKLCYSTTRCYNRIKVK